MAEGIELAVAYVSIVPSVRGLSASLEREMAPAAKAATHHGEHAGHGFVGGMKHALKEGAGLLGLALGVEAGAHFLEGAIENAEKFEIKERLVAQAIEATGGAAHVTDEYVLGLAGSLGKANAVTRGTVLGIASMLLRFEQVKNLGPDKIFDEAAQSALDLSAATGKDAVGAARMLGKALNEPIGGIGALSRAGVSFTAEQKEQIKTLAKSGDLLGAQRLIIEGVQHKYEGAAKAVITPAQRMKVAWAGVKTSIGLSLLPAFDRVVSYITAKIIPAIGQVPNFVREHWSQIAPIIDSVGGVVRNLWGSFMDLVHAIQPAATLLAGAYLAALRAAWGAASTLASALHSVTSALSGQSGIITDVVVAIGGMWLAWRAFGIAQTAFAFIRTELTLMTTRIGLAGLAVQGFGLTSMLALGAVGVAIGVATYLWQRHRQAVQAAKEAAAAEKQEIESLTSAIEADNGALGESTRKIVYDTLVKKGAIDVATKYGLSLADVVDAAMGNVDALNRLYEAEQQTALGSKSHAQEAGKLTAAIGTTSEELDSSVEAASHAAEGIDRVKKSTQDTTIAMQSEEDAAKGLKDSLDELSGKHLTEAQSELQLQSQLVDLHKAFKDNGRSLDSVNRKTGTFTKGSIANRQALLSAMQTINDHANAVMDSTGSTKSATAALSKDEAMLLKAATASGMNKRQVRSLIKAYEAVPSDVKTAIGADVKPAKKAVDSIKPELNSGFPTDTGAVNGTARLHIGAVADASVRWTQSQWESWIAQYRSTTVHLQADLATSATGRKTKAGATGGYKVPPGWTLTGERGPEMISPQGLIMPADRTARMINNHLPSGGGAMRMAGGRLSLSADSQGNLAAWMRDVVIADDQFADTVTRMGSGRA